MHQQFLSLADDVLNAGLADGYAGLEILPGNFLEWQKAVAIFSIVDEASFKRRLDARDNGLVDVALALLTSFNLDLIVEQFLPVDNGQPAFLGLGGVNQHPFHGRNPSIQK